MIKSNFQQEMIDYYVFVLEQATYDMGFDVASQQTLQLTIQKYIDTYNSPPLPSKNTSN